MGFSLRLASLVESMGSRPTGFSSYDSQASLLCGMWDLPEPGMEPMSPALPDGLLTNELPGKPDDSLF